MFFYFNYFKISGRKKALERNSRGREMRRWKFFSSQFPVFSSRFRIINGELKTQENSKVVPETKPDLLFPSVIELVLVGVTAHRV